MITKSDIIKAAYEHGYEDVGFTTADPFPDHKQLLLDRREEYEWAEAVGLELLNHKSSPIFTWLTVSPSVSFPIIQPKGNNKGFTYV